MSFDNVINGPVARAGSIFNLFNNNGKAVPKIEANIITTKSDNATVKGNANDALSNKSVSKNISMEHIVALSSDPPISLSILLKLSCTDKEFVAIA